MAKLFVDKTVEINAPAAAVWRILTERHYTDQWAAEFSSGGPKFSIESDWQLGSPVLWKGEDGAVVVEGNVTALQLGKLLRFTVFDVRAERPPTTDADGINFELNEQDGKTSLHVLQGDFGVMEDGQQYRDMSAQVWDRVLPKIKVWSEELG